MSKLKKLFSVFLVTLLLCQPLLVRASATTGKYTAADDLPAIYGAGVSVEDFEACEATDAAKTGTFSKVRNTNNFTEATLQIIDDAAYAAKGSKALKVTGARGTFSFHLNLGSDLESVSEYKNLAFYVNIPSGTVTVPEDKLDATKFPDGQYGLKLLATSQYWTNISSSTALSNMTVTYYFPSGKKLVKTNESGVYAYKEDGTVSSTGFQGYVSVSLPDDLNISTNPYVIFRVFGSEWASGFASNSVFYFDDFRLLHSDWFVPYALMDYESVSASWNPTSWYTSNSLTFSRAANGAVPSFDTTGQAQGANALKIVTSNTRGHFNAHFLLTSSGAAAPRFGTGYNGISFYIDIPALTSTAELSNFKPVLVGLNSNGDYSPTTLLNAIFVYWFEDGSVLAKYGDDGLYPYDPDGNLTYDGFTGYVSVYFGEDPLTTNRFFNIYGQDWNPLLYSGQTIYIDDIRPCYFDAVEEFASGDAYYIDDTAVCVRQVDEEATLSVMTNMASLGMARSAEGLAALRRALLGRIEIKAKHDVNKDGQTDIRDLVKLNALANG